MHNVSRSPSSRVELHARGLQLGRELSTRAALFHQAIAMRLGLGASDHKFIGILSGTGPVTAGRLADLTGLTTGAVTGVIDRLERAGFVRRDRDPGDRRRVIIRPLPEARATIAPHMESIARATLALYSRYSEQELTLVFQYLAEVTRMLHEETLKLREETVRVRAVTPRPRRRGRSVPVAAGRRAAPSTARR